MKNVEYPLILRVHHLQWRFHHTITPAHQGGRLLRERGSGCALQHPTATNSTNEQVSFRITFSSRSRHFRPTNFITSTIAPLPTHQQHLYIHPKPLQPYNNLASASDITTTPVQLQTRARDTPTPNTDPSTPHITRPSLYGNQYRNPNTTHTPE